MYLFSTLSINIYLIIVLSFIVDYNENDLFISYAITIISYYSLEIYVDITDILSLISYCQRLISINIQTVLTSRYTIQYNLYNYQLTELHLKKKELSQIRVLLVKFMSYGNESQINASQAEEIFLITQRYYLILLSIGKLYMYVITIIFSIKHKSFPFLTLFFRV